MTLQRFFVVMASLILLAGCARVVEQGKQAGDLLLSASGVIKDLPGQIRDTVEFTNQEIEKLKVEGAQAKDKVDRLREAAEKLREDSHP